MLYLSRRTMPVQAVHWFGRDRAHALRFTGLSLSVRHSQGRRSQVHGAEPLDFGDLLRDLTMGGGGGAGRAGEGSSMVPGLVIHQDPRLQEDAGGPDVRVRPCLALLGAGGRGVSGLRAGLTTLGLSGGPLSPSCLALLSDPARFPVLRQLLLEEVVWEGGASAAGSRGAKGGSEVDATRAIGASFVESLIALCAARSVPSLPAQGDSPRMSAPRSSNHLLRVIVVGMLTGSEAEAVREGLRARGIVHDDAFESLDELEEPAEAS